MSTSLLSRISYLETKVRGLEHEQKLLRKSLQECVNAIHDEVSSYGDENEHPIVKAHAEAMRKAQALLLELEARK